jgi:hypothetical protein
MPNLRTVMLHVQKTYYVVPQTLSKLYQLIACKKLRSKHWKRSKSRNRRDRNKNTFKYRVLVPDSPKKTKEINHANDNNL